MPEDLTEPFDPETGIGPRKQPSERETDERLGPTRDTSASSFCCSAMALKRVRRRWHQSTGNPSGLIGRAAMEMRITSALHISGSLGSTAMRGKAVQPLNSWHQWTDLLTIRRRSCYF